MTKLIEIEVLDVSRIFFRIPFTEYFIAKGEFELLCLARKKFDSSIGRYYFIKI